MNTCIFMYVNNAERGKFFCVSGPVSKRTLTHPLSERKPLRSQHLTRKSIEQAVQHSNHDQTMCAGCSALLCPWPRGKEITLDAPSLASNRTFHLSRNLLRTSRDQCCDHDKLTNHAAAFPIAFRQWTRIATTECHGCRRYRFANLQTMGTKTMEEGGQGWERRNEKAEDENENQHKLSTTDVVQCCQLQLCGGKAVQHWRGPLEACCSALPECSSNLERVPAEDGHPSMLIHQCVHVSHWGGERDENQRRRQLGSC